MKLKFRTDGYIITDGKSFMGIHSATMYLNELSSENEKLKTRIEQLEALDLERSVLKASLKIKKDRIKQLEGLK